MGPLRINIVVGGRFHAGQLYSALTAQAHDVHIYTSSPARYFRAVPKAKITVFLKPVQLLQKGLKRRMPRWMAERSAVAFDTKVARTMRQADLVWGFNGDSLSAGRRIKAQGGHYLVDRACPHFLTQEALLRAESAAVGYPYALVSARVRRRFMDEYALADAIVVPSNYSAASFPDQGIDAARVLRAPLDANAPRGTAQSAPPLDFDGVSPGDFRVGMVGGSFLRKGILYLLRAVAALDRPNLRLLIRADADTILRHGEARALCQRLAVVFVPYLKDINSFYRSIDCLVLPSIDEGFGMVVYEALSNGTPVIASTHVGAIDDMVAGEEFLKVPVADVPALAEAIACLASSNDEQDRIGAAGQAFYRARMTGGGQYAQSLARILARVTAAAD